MVFNKRFLYFSIISTLLIAVCLLGSCRSIKNSDKQIIDFNGWRAYQDVLYQVSLGPRIPDTPGHERVVEWLTEELENNHWIVSQQESIYGDKKVINLVAKREKNTGYILLGAHYDTRIFADQDPEIALRKLPLQGANDGASGVAVLLELARVIPENLPVPVQLVFFDAEDNGGIGSWDWILGSRAYESELKDSPSAVIIVDMIGDADLDIYYEHNSEKILMDQIWEKAWKMGYGHVFQDEYRYSMLDDHTPFVEAGIPSVDLIDFDYPYWHTTEDTVDKVSPESLEAVGKTLAAWLQSVK